MKKKSIRFETHVEFCKKTAINYECEQCVHRFECWTDGSKYYAIAEYKPIEGLDK